MSHGLTPETEMQWYRLQFTKLLEAQNAASKAKLLVQLLLGPALESGPLIRDVRYAPPFVYTLEAALERRDKTDHQAFVATACDLTIRLSRRTSHGRNPKWADDLISLIIEYSALHPLSDLSRDKLSASALTSLKALGQTKNNPTDNLTTRLLQILIHLDAFLSRTFWMSYIKAGDRRRTQTVFDGLSTYHIEDALRWLTSSQPQYGVVSAFKLSLPALLEKWGRPRLESLLEGGRTDITMKRRHAINRVWIKNGFEHLWLEQQVNKASVRIRTVNADTMQGSILDDLVEKPATTSRREDNHPCCRESPKHR